MSSELVINERIQQLDKHREKLSQVHVNALTNASETAAKAKTMTILGSPALLDQSDTPV